MVLWTLPVTFVLLYDFLYYPGMVNVNNNNNNRKIKWIPVQLGNKLNEFTNCTSAAGAIC